jgi:hypothetical protein
MSEQIITSHSLATVILVFLEIHFLVGANIL